MDNKIMNKMIFDIFKNIIIEQNKELFKEIAKINIISEKKLLEIYLKPEFYLPIVIKSLDTPTTPMKLTNSIQSIKTMQKIPFSVSDPQKNTQIINKNKKVIKKLNI